MTPRRAQTRKLALLSLAGLLALAHPGCGESEPGSGPATGEDEDTTGRRDRGRDAGDDGDAGAEDATSDPSVADDPAADSRVTADVVVNDGFVRPPLPDASGDASDDTGADGDGVSDGGEGDAGDGDVADDDVSAEDARDEETTELGLRRSGRVGCLDYELETGSDVLDLKVDNIFIAYRVVNACSTDIRFSAEHENDFFAFGLEKNGEPWIFLQGCPHRGQAKEEIWAPREGIRRGDFWRAEDHEADLARCGATFDPEAEYSIVGYGLTELLPSDVFGTSDFFRLTDPIPVDLQIGE